MSTEGEQEGRKEGEDRDEGGLCENRTMDVKRWIRKAQNKECKRKVKGWRKNVKMVEGGEYVEEWWMVRRMKNLKLRVSETGKKSRIQRWFVAPCRFILTFILPAKLEEIVHPAEVFTLHFHRCFLSENCVNFAVTHLSSQRNGCNSRTNWPLSTAR